MAIAAKTYSSGEMANLCPPIIIWDKDFKNGIFLEPKTLRNGPTPLIYSRDLSNIDHTVVIWRLLLYCDIRAKVAHFIVEGLSRIASAWLWELKWLFTPSQFDHLSVNDEVHWKDEHPNGSIDEVDNPKISPGDSKETDQEAKEDEDEEDAEHDPAEDCEVNPRLEGEESEGDDDCCRGGGRNEDGLSLIEHAGKPEQQGLCHGEHGQHDEVDGHPHAEGLDASHDHDDDEACYCRNCEDRPECSIGSGGDLADAIIVQE